MCCPWCEKQQRDGNDAAPRMVAVDGTVYHLGGATGLARECTDQNKAAPIEYGWEVF